MIAQGENELYLTVGLLRGPGSIPSCGGVFQGIFPGWSQSANSSWASWQKMVQSSLNGTTQLWIHNDLKKIVKIEIIRKYFLGFPLALRKVKLKFYFHFIIN